MCHSRAAQQDASSAVIVALILAAIAWVVACVVMARREHEKRIKRALANMSTVTIKITADLRAFNEAMQSVAKAFEELGAALARDFPGKGLGW